MADRSIELNAAIFAALTGNAALQVTLGGAGRIYNAMAPAGAPVPYLVIGERTAADYGASDGDSQEHTLTLHAFTEEPGYSKCLSILRDTRAVLHEASLTLSGVGRFVNLRCEFQETSRDPDGVSAHGVMRFRAVTQG